MRIQDWTLVGLFAVSGCEEEVVNSAMACVTEASDDLVIEVLVPCASDHRGAKLSCDIEALDAPRQWRLSTTFVDGRDPNDSCADPLSETCSIEGLDPGPATVFYADTQLDLEIPTDELPDCKWPDGRDGTHPGEEFRKE